MNVVDWCFTLTNKIMLLKFIKKLSTYDNRSVEHLADTQVNKYKYSIDKRYYRQTVAPPTPWYKCHRTIKYIINRDK